MLEQGMEAAFQRKKEKCTRLSAACTEAEWKSSTYRVEVCCRGFIIKSTHQILMVFGAREFLVLAQKERCRVL